MQVKVTGTVFIVIDNNCKGFLAVIFLAKHFGVMLRDRKKEKTAACYSSDVLCVHFNYPLFTPGTEILPFIFFSPAERKGVATALKEFCCTVTITGYFVLATPHEKEKKPQPEASAG